ncbi:S-adenosyl-L-methionine-dependent methyltransferase [Xylariales sp. PMI_506]|nr:S-adenosyl-L-methionine-dependent methyltransferase [Xylariales sp. PMI_506]
MDTAGHLDTREDRDDSTVKSTSTIDYVENAGLNERKMLSGGDQKYATPSQLLNSYGNQLPPSRLFSENTTDGLQYQSSGSEDSSGIDVVHELASQPVGRTSSGGSVVEPDSVIGESGRLYHGYKEGKYFLPNDAAEQDRLDLQHEVYSQVLDGWLAIAPLKDIPKYVLDIGTGTGIWASEFAQQNPSSHVIGTDLSAIQPTPTLPNLEYVKADAEDDWVFSEPDPDHSHCSEHSMAGFHPIIFDYIHSRLMITCYNSHLTVMKHAFENLASGGWVEFQEARVKTFQANSLFEGDAIQRWSDKAIEGAASLGRNLECILDYEGWLNESGFVNISRRDFLVPIGSWHSHSKMKTIGLYMRENLMRGLQGSSRMLRAAGMSTTEIDALLEQTRVELQDVRNHSYANFYVFTAQKPATGTVQ